MNNKEIPGYGSQETPTPRLKLVERDCPRCDSIIMKDEKDDCYQCVKCGFIDCGINE
jgi:ribosomal protein S27AE